MESAKEEQEKAPEQQSPPAESTTENQPKIDIYEQMKTLTEEEKKLCPNKISEYIQSLYSRGLIQKKKDSGVLHVPVSLSPSPLPKNLFGKIFFYQIAFNKIYNKLSNDQEFLEKTLEQISSKDNFVQKMLEICLVCFTVVLVCTPLCLASSLAACFRPSLYGAVRRMEQRHLSMATLMPPSPLSETMWQRSGCFFAYAVSLRFKLVLWVSISIMGSASLK